MASSRFSQLYHRWIAATLQPPPPNDRTMASGPCTALVAVGELEVECPCKRGVFEVPLSAVPPSTLDVACKACRHPLAQHTDAPPQGMASFAIPVASSKATRHLIRALSLLKYILMLIIV